MTDEHNAQVEPNLPEKVGWETEAEWELEQRAFLWNPEWSEDETRKLINDLWQQYCLAAAPVPPVSDGKVEPVAWLTQRYQRGMWVETNLHLEEPAEADELVIVPLFASPPARHSSEEVESLRAALWPFADIADFMDTETTGFAMTDELSLICRGDDGAESALFHDFKVSDFYAARTALQRDAQGGGE